MSQKLHLFLKQPIRSSFGMRVKLVRFWSWTSGIDAL